MGGPVGGGVSFLAGHPEWFRAASFNRPASTEIRVGGDSEPGPRKQRQRLTRSVSLRRPLSGHGPFKCIMATAGGDCFDGSRGRGLASGHAVPGALADWLEGGEEAGAPGLAPPLLTSFSGAERAAS